MRGDGEQVAVRCVIMRGGTSKALFLRSADLPSDPAVRDRFILALFGSPDPRQIDGLGGADLLTSKLAIVGPPSRPDADLDYTFAQVSITEPVVTYDINCGNISAAVGVYAIQEGFVPPREPRTTVRIHNTNTGTILVAQVPVRDGAPAVEGACVIDGVPGSGAEVRLDYRETGGGATGALLPTGRPRDRLAIAELERTLEISVVDIGNLCVFFRAHDAGLTGREEPRDLGPEQLARIDAIRARTAAWLGLPTDGLTPIPTAVAPPATYRRFTDGSLVAEDEVDLLARVVGGRPPALHKAFPGTAGVCVGVAAAIDGTVVQEVSRTDGVPPDVVRIGHPSGTFVLRARVRRSGDTWRVEEAAYARTARRLMEGHAFVRRSVLEEAGAARQLRPGRAATGRAPDGSTGTNERSLAGGAPAARA